MKVYYQYQYPTFYWNEVESGESNCIYEYVILLKRCFQKVCYYYAHVLISPIESWNFYSFFILTLRSYISYIIKISFKVFEKKFELKIIWFFNFACVKCCILWGWNRGGFSWKKVSRWAHYNATEAGQVVWDTLYNAVFRNRLNKEYFSKIKKQSFCRQEVRHFVFAGQKYAMLEVKAVVSTVLRKFRLLPSSIPVTPSFKIVRKSATGIHLRLEARDKS